MKIQVKMTARDIFDFSMYSAYSGPGGIFTFVFLILVIGILGYAWSAVEMMQRVMLLGCIVLFVVVQPIMLWTKAGKHAKTTGYSTPINLDISDEQIGVEQAGVTGELKWDQIWKVVRIHSMYIIKVGPTHGYLVPFRALEGRNQEFVDLCKRNLPPKKTKGLKA